MGKEPMQRGSAGCSQDGAETKAIPGSDLTLFAKCLPPSRRQSEEQEWEFWTKEGGGEGSVEEGWGSEEESDSAVSLERNLLQQHLYCIRWELQLFDKQIFSLERMSANAIKAESVIFSQTLTLHEYLQNGESLLSSAEVVSWLRVLQEQWQLQKYLQVLFDTASQLYCDELILAAYRTTCEYWRFKHLDLAVRELCQLAADPVFLRNVYSHPRLTLIGFHLLPVPMNANGSGFGAALARFQQIFSLNVLLVVQNYFNNPWYEAVREEQVRVEKEERRRSEKKGRKGGGKRIGKRKESQV